MNYANLTQKEILNYADPKTELEIALIGIINDGLSEFEDEAESAKSEVDCLAQELDDCRDEISGLESSLAKCQEWAEKIKSMLSDSFNQKDEVLRLLDLIGGE